MTTDLSPGDVMADPDLDRRVRAFLYLEARLADEGRYRDWLGLWSTRDPLYWVVPHDDVDPRREVSYVYDDRDLLEQRVARWDSGFAWAQVPRSLTNRIVANVEFVAHDPTSVTVRAIVHVCVARKGYTDLIPQRVTYRLGITSVGFEILEKKVVLQGEQPVGNITFVL